MGIGAVILEMRLKRGMKQNELARIANVSAGLLCHYESGHKTPGIAVLTRIARGLGTEASTIMANLEGRNAA